MKKLILESDSIEDLLILSSLARRLGVTVSAILNADVPLPLASWNNFKVDKMATDLQVANRNRDMWTEKAEEYIKSQNIISMIKHVRNYNNIGFGLIESKVYVENILEGKPI